MSFIYIHKKEIEAIFEKVEELTRANDLEALKKLKGLYVK